MKVYLVLENELKRGAIENQPCWELQAPYSLNLLVLRNHCVTQLNQQMESLENSWEERILNLYQIDQITPNNLPHLVIDSPAWNAGDEFLVFRLFQDPKRFVFFRMPRPLQQGNQFQYQNTTLLDWVSLTYQTERPFDYHLIEAWIERMNQTLIPLFGFGITAKKDKGWFGYTDSFILGNHWGMVATGGQSQQHTVFVSLTGQGCSIAQLGWEQRLFEFLSHQALSPRLTRVDIAFDDYEGQYLTPEDARTECQKREHGIFYTKGQAPSWEVVGDWDSPTGKKTLYVGSPSSDKRLRVYTKGRALGDPDSPWIRAEWRLKHSKRFLLPFDLLTQSSQYMANAYSTTHQPGPFQFLGNEDSVSPRLKLASHTVEISFEQQIRHARRAAGKLINTLKRLGYTDSQIIQQLESQGTPPKLVHSCDLIQRFH